MNITPKEFNMDTKILESLSIESINSAIKDLLQVIKYQEHSTQHGEGFHNLGRCYDDLCACSTELNRRHKKKLADAEKAGTLVTFME